MRTLAGFRLALFFSSMMLVSLSFAQEEKPEHLELLDEVDQPTITIRKPDVSEEITERREDGTVREVKVQTGGSTYYLYPNRQLGSGIQGDTASSVVRPSLWRVHEFDVVSNKPSPEPDDDADGKAAPAPPSPSSTAN
ncbi:MAG: DUF2782 domain-containing protein [Burkholderiaceae bacterium]|jgi:hypothetical protein|nr:DUF2782 domain-containing protein [Burkholderiaceae bacterium]